MTEEHEVKEKLMTKERYVAWVKNRSPDPADWDYNTCVKADSLIKEVALQNFEGFLNNFKLPNSVKSLYMYFVSFHFGSGDVDDVMIELGVYPDWMV